MPVRRGGPPGRGSEADLQIRFRATLRQGSPDGGLQLKDRCVITALGTDPRKRRRPVGPLRIQEIQQARRTAPIGQLDSGANLRRLRQIHIPQRHQFDARRLKLLRGTVNLARELGLTLVGFLRGQRFVIYSGSFRCLPNVP